MLENDVYVKTDAGRDEIRSRSRGLSMALRAILLMVDGQRDVASMRSLIAGSKAPSDVLDVLLAQGLIETRDGAASSPAVRVPSQTAAPVVVTPSPSPAPSAGPISYDGPIDLVLPTIYGPELTPPLASPAPPPAATPVAIAPPLAPATAPPPAAATPDRYNKLYSMMNEVVRDFLAPHRRYFFQLKIERCSTADDLNELLHDLQTALAKARGDAFASDVISRLRSATA